MSRVYARRRTHPITHAVAILAAGAAAVATTAWVVLEPETFTVRGELVGVCDLPARTDVVATVDGDRYEGNLASERLEGPRCVRRFYVADVPVSDQPYRITVGRWSIETSQVAAEVGVTIQAG